MRHVACGLALCIVLAGVVVACLISPTPFSSSKALPRRTPQRTHHSILSPQGQEMQAASTSSQPTNTPYLQPARGGALLADAGCALPRDAVEVDGMPITLRNSTDGTFSVYIGPDDMLIGRAAKIMELLRAACRTPIRAFLTYADEGWATARRRLISQAVATNSFEVVFEYSRSVLEADAFYSRNREILDAPRGGGYWLWKPWAAGRTLEHLRHGDFMMYLDSGCLLQRSPQPWFDEVANVAVPWRAVQMTGEYIGAWTKGDIFEATGVPMESARHIKQMLGGIWAMRVSPSTRALHSEWLRLACVPQLINDDPSIAPNPPGFIENRHDQAIYTLVMLKHNVTTIAVDDTWPIDVAIRENRIVVAARSRA